MTNHQLAKLLLAQPETRVLVLDLDNGYASDVVRVEMGTGKDANTPFSVIVQADDSEHEMV